MSRLKNDNYKRPLVTITEKLTKDDIMDLLEDYVEESIMKIPIGTHVRYFQTINGEQKFRRGGVLKFNSQLPTYVILDNGKKSWSVQINPGTIFYKKMTIKEIKDEYETRIDELEQLVDKLKNIIKSNKNSKSDKNKKINID